MLTHRRQVAAAPTRLVVLGSAGFLGQTLLRLAAEAAIPALPVSRAVLDLTAAGAATKLAEMIRPQDAVVVLAALTPDRGRGSVPFIANIKIADAVTEAFAKVAPDHVVYLSSDAVYSFTEGLIGEDTAAAPTDLYGTMHLAREIIFQSTAKAPIAILRSTMLYGADDTHNSYGPNRLRRMAQKDRRIVLFGQGEEMRDHVVVDDAARLILEVVRHRSEGLLNIASGHSVSYADLAKQIAACFDSPIEIAGGQRQTPITHRHFTVTSLVRALPDFAFTPLGDGLRRAHRMMLEKGGRG
jgi:UDP-glucose 4-epimerase